MASVIGASALTPAAQARPSDTAVPAIDLVALAADVSSADLDASYPDVDYVRLLPGARMLVDTRVQGPPRSIDTLGTFQVDVVPITTSRGTPTIARSTSEKIIGNVSRAYEAMSGGTVKFVLRTIHEPKTSQEDVRSPMFLEQLFDTAPKADAGFAGLILIGVVVPDPALSFAGIAVLGGSNVLINGGWTDASRSIASTVAHEIGHNLWLGHAGAAQCTKPAAHTSCEIREYGDESDFMGSYTIGNVTDPPHLRVSAWHLKRLGFLADDAVREVTTSGEFTIMPAYSGTGTRILTIPVYNGPGYAFEYRPASGADALLSRTQLFIPGTNSYYTNKPSHGVQVRVLQRNTDPERTLLPVAESGPSVSVFASPSTSIQGLQAGEQLALPDGSVVRVLSTDPTAGARVSITIPPDTTKPSLGEAELGWSFEEGDELVMRGKGWQEFWLRARDITDDRRIASVVLEVNGVEVGREDNPSGDAIIEYTPKQVGTFKVRAIARDLAGNETVLERTLSSKRYLYNPVGARLLPGASPTTSLYLWYTAWKGWTYTITELSAGRLDPPRRSGTATYVRIRGLKPGQEVSLRFTATDRKGETDGGQTLTARTRTR